MNTDNTKGLAERFDAYIRKCLDNGVNQVFRIRRREFDFWQNRLDYDALEEELESPDYFDDGDDEWDESMPISFDDKLLEKAFEKLNPKHKRVVALMFYAGKSYAEIGKYLDECYQTVYSRTNRALEKLRKYYRSEERREKKKV